MNYHRTQLKLTFVINKIISMYYYEFDQNYRFPGEYHDFWELVYVHKGEIEVTADQTLHRIKQGTIIFPSLRNPRPQFGWLAYADLPMADKKAIFAENMQRVWDRCLIPKR